MRSLFKQIQRNFSKLPLLSVRSGRATFLLCAFCLLSHAVAAWAEFDFDQDGVSDILSVRILEDDSLRWRSLSSHSGFKDTTTIHTMGELGNHLIPGNWYSTEVATVGLIEKKKDEAIWLIRDSSGQEREVTFGKPADYLISGGDFNFNGYLDAARLLRSGKAVISTDMFAPSTNKSVFRAQYEVKFPRRAGRKGIPLFLNRGSGDELAVLERKGHNRRVFHSLHLRSVSGASESLRFGRVMKHVISGAVPVKQGNGTDAVVFYGGKKNTLVKVYGLAGGLLFRDRYPGSGPVLVGDFLSVPGGELAIQAQDRVFIVNPFTGEELVILAGSGVLADSINVVTFRSQSGGGGSQQNPTPGGNTSPGKGLSGVCSSVKSISSGVLYKPASDVSDNRGGKPAVLFTGSNKTRSDEIKIYAGNGEEVCNFTFKASDNAGVNNGADHYYSGWHGGCDKTGSQIGAAARQASGKSEVYIRWKGGACLGPLNPTDRVGGI